MRTDILGHPPSLCTYRRVWHPAIPTQPLRGCTCLKCTNQARTAPTKLPLHPSTARDFCVFCVFRGTILRNLNICAICGRIIKWVAWVWQGCHTLLSVFCGQYISAWLVQQRLLHPLTFRAFRPSSTSEINDYGYAPGWHLQPKPIVLARRPLSQHGRPA